MNADLSLFFGRFHPLIVHLPIGILLFAALLELLARVWKSASLHQATRVALLCGVGSAALAALSGYVLGNAGGYEAQTLFWHKWLGISVGVLALLAWWVKHRQQASAKQGFSLALALALVLLLSITGHLGANLTHGSDYLTAYLPATLKTWFNAGPQQDKTPALPPHVDSVLVYQHLVQPLLEARCVSCHNPGDARGGLLLTSREAMLKGGSSGPAIVPGNVKKSELIRRITLPHTSPRFMPANKLPALSPLEVHLLKWWVAKGASFKSPVARLEPDEKMQYLLAAYLGMDTEDLNAPVLPEVAPAKPEALEALHAAGVLTRLIAEKSNLLDVSFVMSRQASPQQRQEQLQKLKQVKDQLYWLDLSNCGLSDGDLRHLGQFSNLSRLSIQKNNISDSGLVYLRPLKKLEFLNMHQNPLSDKSILTMQELPALRKINLWQTQVTPKGISSLTAARQRLVVHY